MLVLRDVCNFLYYLYKKGNCEANPHSELLKDDLFTVFGAGVINEALLEVNDIFPGISPLLNLLEIKKIPDRLLGNGVTIPRQTRDAISSFLNRMMLMPTKIQEKLFAMIDDKLESRVEEAGTVFKSLRGNN